MTAKHKYTLTLWLLPLLFLRSLVPAGFMIDTSHGSVSMVICSGGVYKTVQVDQQGTLVEANQAREHQGQNHHGDSLCPFALAASGAPLSQSLPVVLGDAPAIDAVDDDVALLASPFGPIRTQLSRAPPYFS